MGMKCLIKIIGSLFISFDETEALASGYKSVRICSTESKAFWL
ncbi:hypothetical protein MFS40622_0331 [Methanocaldococcus sp. FS406-22]|nr:hypothetical protein [Methanocaldococcus sp. FS406-22]ADC69027.1 hypothetical protein MFS40622_0331 [Methanocaldococcus sp. FS406-22]